VFDAGFKSMPVVVGLVYPWVKLDHFRRFRILRVVEKNKFYSGGMFAVQAEVHTTVHDGGANGETLSMRFVVFRRFFIIHSVASYGFSVYEKMIKVLIS
jgi:hypothetical protein